MQGVKGEVVVIYAEPLTTQQMRYHRLSRVNNSANIIALLDFTTCAFVRCGRKIQETIYQPGFITFLPRCLCNIRVYFTFTSIAFGFASSTLGI
jgi:hypothetical protein